VAPLDPALERQAVLGGCFGGGCVSSPDCGCGLGCERGPVCPPRHARRLQLAPWHAPLLPRTGILRLSIRCRLTRSVVGARPALVYVANAASAPARPLGPRTAVPRSLLLDLLLIPASDPKAPHSFAPARILLPPVLIFLPVPLRQAQLKSLFLFLPFLSFPPVEFTSCFPSPPLSSTPCHHSPAPLSLLATCGEDGGAALPGRQPTASSFQGIPQPPPVSHKRFSLFRFFFTN